MALLIISLEQCVTKGLAPSLYFHRVTSCGQPRNWQCHTELVDGSDLAGSEAFLEQFTPTARGAPLSSALLSASSPTLTPSLSSASPSQQVLMVIMMLQKGFISHWTHELFERHCLVRQEQGEVAIYTHSCMP